MVIFTMPYKQISVGNMNIKWNLKNDRVFFEVFAPTKGWVALGFNTENEIIGSNLVMGAYFRDKTIVEDQYVSSIGVHQKVEELRIQSTIDHTLCFENDVGTILKFSLPCQSSDQYHKSFIKGSHLWLICAYSVEDDFAHHSISREHIKISI